MVNNILSKNDELVKIQGAQLNELVRDLTKWITLKELEKDDEYILRLATKMLEENKKTTTLSFQVGHGVGASFKSAIEKLDSSLEKIFEGRVELIENSNLDKDAIEVEIGSSFYKARFLPSNKNP